MPTLGVVVSLRPGTTAKPTFFYHPVEHPEWTRTVEYELSLPSSATSLREASYPRFSSMIGRLPPEMCDEQFSPLLEAMKERSKILEEDSALPAEVDDVPGLPSPPTEAEWAKVRSAYVPGSDANGCKTQLSGSWFRMVCKGKVEFVVADILAGQHATQTTASVSPSEVSLVTPYVEGTALNLLLMGLKGEETVTSLLRLRWKKGGKRPYEIGKIIPWDPTLRPKDSPKPKSAPTSSASSPTASPSASPSPSATPSASPIAP